MAKGPSFNFGAFAPKKSGKKKKATSGKKRGGGNRSNAWRAYTRDNGPIPD